MFTFLHSDFVTAAVGNCINWKTKPLDWRCRAYTVWDTSCLYLSNTASSEEVCAMFPNPLTDAQSLDIQQQAPLREKQRHISPVNRQEANGPWAFEHHFLLKLMCSLSQWSVTLFRRFRPSATPVSSCKWSPHYDFIKSFWQFKLVCPGCLNLSVSVSICVSSQWKKPGCFIPRDPSLPSEADFIGETGWA